MLSQLFRPGWRARFSNGQTEDGYQLLGGFTGFDLPPNTASTTLYFHPTARIALTLLTWITLGLTFLAIGGLAVAGPWRHLRSRGGRRRPPRT